MEPGNIIDFLDVSFGFPGLKNLFKGVSLSIQEGAFYVLEGPSGAGKSTFLRLINRLEEPVSGVIRFRGKPLANYSPPRLRRSLLYIQQTPTAIDGSVKENLLRPFSFKNNHHLHKPDHTKIETLLKDLHMQDVQLDDHARTLSVGQLQRLSLVRGLLLNPEVLLLDEPTSALDRESALAVMVILEKLNLESHLTVIAVTHRMEKTENIPYRHLFLRNGRIEVFS